VGARQCLDAYTDVSVTPRRKIVIGFVICIVASLLASYAALFVAMANMGGTVWMSGHNPRSDAAMVAAAIAPVVVFIIGGLKPAFNADVSFHYTLPFPWASASR